MGAPDIPSAKSQYEATETTTVGRSFVLPASETFIHDSDGSLIADGRWTHSVWDGENQLVEMRRDSTTPSAARQKLNYEYDHLVRRAAQPLQIPVIRHVTDVSSTVGFPHH